MKKPMVNAVVRHWFFYFIKTRICQVRIVMIKISFFVLYFATKVAKFIAILLLVQIAVYRLSGFSIYKFAMKKANKLLN